MRRISLSLDQLKSHYDVVVIGSGYGGSIAASRLARAGQKVCLLERGKEFLPGEFPDTLPEALSEMQFRSKKGNIGAETGLYDVHVNDDINAVVGCGLGGTSLINANAVIEAEPRVYDDPAWPQDFVNDLQDGMKKGYDRARAMLGANPYPSGAPGFPSLKKTEAHKKCGEALGEEFRMLDLAVTFKKNKDNINAVGVEQHPCINCGDCVSGCNHTAKNTTQMNYLPDAYNFGAEIFTEVNVEYLEKQAGKWKVHFKAVGAARAIYDVAHPFVSADLVVVSAGTLGSTEIMLRSREKGLSCSDKLGENFTGNGDVLGFAYNSDQRITGVGWGNRAPDEKNPVGPTITGIVDTRKSSQDYHDGMSIEEGALPGPLTPGLPQFLSTLSKLVGKDTDSGVVDFISEKTRELKSFLFGAYHGAAQNTQTYLIMTHDSSDGKMVLEEDKLRIKWPGLGKQKIFEKADKVLMKMTEVLGGTYIPNPLWSDKSLYPKFFGNDLVTVHPLGGCIMAEDASLGVTNHKGQVYSAQSGTAVHEGLYISDGAIIPKSIGTNPLLTISALAERNMEILTREKNWEVNAEFGSLPPSPTAPLKPGIQFTETMTGYFSTEEKNDYQVAADKGKSSDSPFEFTLTVISNDLETMLSEENHEARMFGTVDAPALSNEVLTVNGGIFNLFVRDPENVDTKKMVYRMKIAAQDGKTYYFEGFKSIHDDPGLDLWLDTTTLYITLYDGADATVPVLGKGILKILPLDFAKQMTTMKAINVKDTAGRLKSLSKFGTFFAGSLFDTYGSVLSGLNYLNPEAEPRKKRVLRVSVPEVHDFRTEDGVNLRLTRYEGGRRGPVILAHGLGVSSRIFSTDTIDTNLLEYLHAHRFDVWLLDFRVSIELPAALMQSTGDEIAQYDYPAAVETVRMITGAETVQMVVHCYGAATWTMSMLGGHLKHVRSAVVSQVSTHAKAALGNKMKSGLFVPTLLDKLGVDSLTAYVDEGSAWHEKLLDKALKLYPIQKEEQCENPVCRRVTFLYGQLYEHDQINDVMHRNIHELFSVANISAFEQLALIFRKGHLVDADGREKYLPHLERLAIPITFISGAENDCYLPESTEITYKLLQEKNGKKGYKRHLIPNYSHIDCIFGKNAVQDVYPHILDGLNEEAL